MKITLTRTGDNEPKCPKCGNENAMLYKSIFTEDAGFNPVNESVYFCRDCGFTVNHKNACIYIK